MPLNPARWASLRRWLHPEVRTVQGGPGAGGWFCRLPFTEITIDPAGDVYPACCPDWVAFPMGNLLPQAWEEVWNGERAQAFRASAYDGTLRYCDRNWCPHLSDVSAGLKSDVVLPLEDLERGLERYSRPLRKAVRKKQTRLEEGPVHAVLNYDPSCNLQCPSCRNEVRQATGEERERILRIHKTVTTGILPRVRSISLTGVGDPFGGRIFREFLEQYDSRRFPKIESIHFNTNGQLFSPQMYARMPGLHGLRLSTDISIDATTPEVYEKLRWPGRWDRLMENLQFLRTLRNLHCLGISMVVQHENYQQMLDFIRLGESLVHRNRYTFVEFKRIRQWGHVPEETFRQTSMANLSASEKEEFLRLLRSVEQQRIHNAGKGLFPVIRHNLQEYLQGGAAKNRLTERSGFKR
jgi:MoaA/NifB/PqqE/SkfB family radical SAM enzyme